MMYLRKNWTKGSLFGCRPIASVFVGFVLYMASISLDWPAARDPIPMVIRQAAGPQANLLGRADVYDFWGNFIDSQQLWRVEVKPTIIPALMKELELRELPAADKIPRPFWRQMPYWWRPPHGKPARYFISPMYDGFNVFDGKGRGDDGTFYLMAYDATKGILYVWYKNNF